MQKAIEGGFDGMIVYVNKAGKSSFYSAGFNNREEQIPANPRSLFKIASISKLYIAAAAAKLVVSEQLSLESTLAELIPEVRGRIEYADEITLRMMLQHRSGIRGYRDEPGFEEDTDDDYLTVAALVFDKPADFEPNKKYKYSNTNYLLIAEAIERVIGYSHHQYIKEEILIPLGLKNTFGLYSQVDSTAVMEGYLKEWGPSLKSWDHKLPGGSMVATAEDVGSFLRSLIDGTLFTEEEQALYSTIYEYEHTGWLPGYTSIARYHADMDAVIIQFVNTSGKRSFWIQLERVYNRIVRSVENEE